MVLMTEGRFVEALRALDTMFEVSRTDEARTRPMLAAARDNYRKLSNLVANDRVSESFKVDLIDIDCEGAKIGRVRKTIVTIVDDDGKFS